jgi:hypothetical protein
MRLLNGTLPTEVDMIQTRLEIRSLSGQETSLDPQLRQTFHEQIQSAENQLKALGIEIADPRLKIASSSGKLRKTIARLWNKLNTTLIKAHAYCSI